MNGDVLPVEGILPMVAEAKRRGISRCMVAAKNVQEASLIEGIKIYGMKNLRQVIRFLDGQSEEEPCVEQEITGRIETATGQR